MSDLARVAPPQQKKRAPPHPQQKKKNAPPPPFLPTPPGHSFCNFLPNPAPNAPPSIKLCKRFQSTESFQGHHASIVFANGGGRAAPHPTPPLFKTVPARFSAYESCPSLSCEHWVCKWGGRGLRPPPTPRFLKPCQLASKQRNPFRTHHESIPPRLKKGGGLCFLAGQTCFKHTNPFQTHDDASIVFANGGGCAPPTPPPFLAGNPASKLTNPFQTHDASIVFSNATVCAAPNPPEKRGNICLLSYENSDKRNKNTFNCKSHIEITQRIRFSCIPLSCLPH